MSRISVNQAGPWQIMVLLDLDRDGVQKVLAERPFATLDDLHAILPEEARHRVTGLDLVKLDINAMDASRLGRLTGITAPSATEVSNKRPYFFMRQIRALVTDSEYSLIDAVVSTPDLEYVDKLTGKAVSLQPDPELVLVSRSESESVSDAIKRLGLRLVYPEAKGALYEVLAMPETESSADMLGDLQHDYGRNVLPAYKDATSSRYLNPKFCSVQFRDETSEEEQAPILQRLGLDIEQRHRSIGLYTVRIRDAVVDPAALGRALAALNALPEVRFAEPNYFGFDDREQGQSAATSAQLDVAWNLRLTHVPEAWQITRGLGDRVIALIDSGIDMTHPALAGSLVSRPLEKSWNFASDGVKDPIDDAGHGTFIAGLIVGNGAQDVFGICPGCRVLPLRVPLAGEVDSYARRRDAILFALDAVEDPTHLTINLSWKTTGDVTLIRDAITIATQRGVQVVASAGNGPERQNEPHYPSDYPDVISVAAVGPNGLRASYSYFGDAVDLSSPGGDPDVQGGGLTSAMMGGGTTQMSGTSFAAPHVAAVDALLSSLRPSLSAKERRLILQTTANPLSEVGMGRGLLDAHATLANAGPSAAPSTGVTLAFLNTAELEDLAARYGLLSLTARLIVSRRPIAEVADIQDVLGLTQAQYAAISGG
jgi:subtilisin family serine protease